MSTENAQDQLQQLDVDGIVDFDQMVERIEFRVDEAYSRRSWLTDLKDKLPSDVDELNNVQGQYEEFSFILKAESVQQMVDFMMEEFEAINVEGQQAFNDVQEKTGGKFPDDNLERVELFKEVSYQSGRMNAIVAMNDEFARYGFTFLEKQEQPSSATDTNA